MIELYNVYKSYKKNTEYVLSNINLKIDKGEFVFITGPSGAGKTTLLKLMLLAEKPTTGQIIVAHMNLTAMKQKHVYLLRRMVGFIYQDYKLLESRTVLENVALPLEILGVHTKEAHKKTLLLLRSVGLHGKYNEYPRALSGGEQQRVSVARALIHEPSILLVDEPTGNVDEENAEIIMSLIRSYNDKGTTVVLATHDKNIIKKYPRRMISLEKGNIEA